MRVTSAGIQYLFVIIKLFFVLLPYLDLLSLFSNICRSTTYNYFDENLICVKSDVCYFWDSPDATHA